MKVWVDGRLISVRSVNDLPRRVHPSILEGVLNRLFLESILHNRPADSEKITLIFNRIRKIKEEYPKLHA
ncbi:MAG: hypothetical protein QXR62_03680 [Candidatus Bathyarchaeia archaeon]